METVPDPDKLLTPEEVAVILDCNRRTVIRYTRLKDNPLKVEKHSKRRFRFRRSDVEEFRRRARLGNDCNHTFALEPGDRDSAFRND